MPPVDYKTALQRFNASKARFESALNSNKKAFIATAAAALIAAIAMLIRSRRQVEEPISEPSDFRRGPGLGEGELVEESSDAGRPVPVAQPVGGTVWGAYGAMLDAGSGEKAHPVGSGSSAGSSSAGVPSRYRGYYSE